ncbi:MAG: 3-hydroxyacyl-CoA dehydrogenase/enoyl-CoA hydratase family protein [Betaproteobacteria bacterium]|nr:3-hydroxyacyl-CoA dehydrogenase/enoyl-CoA hydratase family protein [Betaproteobacteria bacterium]
MSKFHVRRAAVLGAGVMGAQIAAHLANADIPVILFDLPAREGDKSGIVLRALEGLKKLEPAPLAANERLDRIEAANYDEHLARMGECDLVIEAIAERMDWKLDLFARVAPHLKPGAIFATNTSGLSIARLAEGLPQAQRDRFCGIHFFNPPRYMALVELIPTAATQPEMLDDLETFLTTALGKSVVRALDTPNFVANRIGVFSILAVMHHTARLGLAFDEADALTGPLIGRPRSATYRTADVVGLDTMAHVINTMRDALADDPWHAHFTVPAWLEALIARGALGQKTRAGIYRKDGKAIKVLSLETSDYIDSGREAAPEVLEILKLKNPAERFARLRASEHPHAQFLWSIFRDVFHYCAVHLGAVADNARDVDLAMRWGFGWQAGPFETWQAAGWQGIGAAIAEDIAAGRTMAAAPLPGWVGDGRSGVHGPQGSWSAREATDKPRSTLPCYRRQLFPDRVLGELEPASATLWENDGVRLWVAEGHGDVPVLSMKTRGVLTQDVVEGIIEAVARAERDHRGLVIWNPQPPFAYGADLKGVLKLIAAGDFAALERFVARFQHMTQTVKYAQVPVVVGLNGMALGGGCEITLHSARAVAALETYVGLVEAGVGLIPAGGGCKELALRAARLAPHSANNEVFPFLQNVFSTVAMASVGKSALHARELGLLRDSDVVVFHPGEVLHVALGQAGALAESGWRPRQAPRGIAVAGRAGIANCEMMLVNMREGGQISEHDHRVARAVATALCGGDIDAGSLVSEQWLLDVERALFVELLKQEKTQARIEHTMRTGKPLRN